MFVMPSQRPRRPFGLVAYVGVFLAVALVALLAGVASAVLEEVFGLSGFAVRAALLGLTFVVAGALCVWWWRGIDEAAREAHKWAWWWGGTGGMAAGAVVMLSLRLGDEMPTGLARMDPGELFAGGMMAILLFQVAGYLIAWAAWWLRHR